MRLIMVTFGVTFLALGILGIFLPLLPTTPLLLLASGCFVKSSDHLYDWLINHKRLGVYIKLYKNRKPFPFKMIASTLIALWLTLGYSIIYVTSSLYVRFLLVVIGVGVSIHVSVFGRKRKKWVN